MKSELYNDANPKTTIHGLGFRNAKVAKESIKIVREYFNNLYKKQKIPDYSSKYTLPMKYLETKQDALRYYKNQIMYRILGLRNRAKSMLERTTNKKNMREAISVFDRYLKSGTF
jgi:hypothetical protein